MTHRYRRMLPLMLALTVTAPNALALGMGEPTLYSPLNAPVEARIPLLDTSDLTASELTVALASDARFERAGLERSAQTDTLSLSVEGAPGALYARLEGKLPLRAPSLPLLLTLSWPEGQLARQINLLPTRYPESTPGADPASTSETIGASWPLTMHADKEETWATFVERMASERQSTAKRMAAALASVNPGLAQIQESLTPYAYGPVIMPSPAQLAGNERPQLPPRADVPAPEPSERLTPPAKVFASNDSNAANNAPAPALASRVEQLEAGQAALGSVQTLRAQLIQNQQQLQASDARIAELTAALSAQQKTLDETRRTLSARLERLSYAQQPTSTGTNTPRISSMRGGDWLIGLGSVVILGALGLLMYRYRARRARDVEHTPLFEAVDAEKMVIDARPTIEPRGPSAPTMTSAITTSERDAPQETAPPARDEQHEQRRETRHETAREPESIDTPEPTSIEFEPLDEASSGNTDSSVSAAKDLAAHGSPPEAMPALDFTLADKAADPEPVEAPSSGEGQDVVDIFIAHGRVDAAREMLEGELESNPRNARARLKLMEVLATLGEATALERHFEHLAGHDDSYIRTRAHSLTGREDAGTPLKGQDRVDALFDLDGPSAEADATHSAPNESSWALEEVAFASFDQDNDGSHLAPEHDERLTKAHLLLEEDRADEAMALLFEIIDDGDDHAQAAARGLLERYETN
ncbi:type IV pilus assembly protein FimV [Larsenimonas suaedae]|uniref:FimV N-terminal domain-containing protein n=1 Tax=Larsenimonas suaedae TaxID=1851019 RepID=A0ABU1GXB6_9GAMM|nr:hypothetical protein [Larsenimonas suaedae]MCM2971437.1 hypothetical protein [Larsenimonas suaedae]MDR5896693.1 hypothetical protein [Larsenimonas suaedae]